MGLLDDLRMATGIALEPLEAYQRAFEKGVLLGSTHFNAASQIFRDAGSKLASANGPLAARAHANANIYQFLATNEPSAAQLAADQLTRISHIEVPGTQSEIMEGHLLASELGARSLERRAAMASGMPASTTYAQAARAWVPLFDRRLVTFALAGDDGYADSGSTRFFLNTGMAAMHRAEALCSEDPDAAAEQFAASVQAFMRCGAEQYVARSRERLRASRAERHCWFCGRLVRGIGAGLRVLHAPPSAYFAKIAAADREQGESYDPAGRLYACGICADVVDSIAAARANAVRDEMNRSLTQVAQSMQSMLSRLASLEGAISSLRRY